MAQPNPELILPLGEPAPLFELPDLDGAAHRLEEYRGRVVVVNFWSAECPWSERADQALRPLLERWGPGVVLLTVASNASEPPELLRRTAAGRGLAPVLHDARQEAADRYGAQTTPHLFVIDTRGLLRYQGAFDDVTFRRRTPSQGYLAAAVEALQAGRLPDPAQTPPYGCSIVRFGLSG